MTALRDESGAIVGFGKVLRDRTDLKGRMDALWNRVNILSQRAQGKTAFLDALAHELGNTFYSVGLVLEVMRRSLPHSPEMEQFLPVLERQSTVMKRLLGDLNEVIQIGTDRLELELARANLNEIVQQATETCRALADQRRQELLALLPPAPLEVEADSVRLHQVCVNLVGNAVKYTPEGGHIAVKMTAEGAEAVIKVEDTGVGIAPETLPQIFELFTREASDETETPPGWGVGLWLVRNIVMLHGGTVAVRSEGKGKGSEFVVRLPLSGTTAAGPAGPIETGADEPAAEAG
jgi:signal transduction histidine kinase